MIELDRKLAICLTCCSTFVDEKSVRNQILADDPAVLYGF